METKHKLNRAVTRRAVLFAFGAALGKLDVLHASNGQLTVDLAQWGGIIFKHRGRSITISIDEVFEALSQGVK